LEMTSSLDRLKFNGTQEFWLTDRLTDRMIDGLTDWLTETPTGHRRTQAGK
jgi:hypothetical protein